MRPIPLLLLLAACSREPETQASAPAPERAPVLALRPTRDLDPRIVALRAHVEFGHLEEARALAEELGLARGDGEATLLRARIAALEGQNVEALRLVEAARRERPADPDVYATSAEIYASAGKLDAAWEEILAGEKAAGPAPELDRARGVVWISRQRGARKGLALLEAAGRADRDLPFLARPTSQAHLLLGKDAAANGEAPVALVHARHAAAKDPEDVDVARFLGEALALNGDFDGAIAETERLVASGLPLGAELALLHKKAAMGALLARERERAIDHFAEARKLGLTDEELATGARMLEEEVLARVKLGVEAYAAGDLAASEAAFQRALALDPDRIEAKNHLGVVLFQRGAYAEAAACWEAVCATASSEGILLPEPVHVNLAKARALAGDLPGARATLEAYLVHAPDGEWAGETRAALAALPESKAGN